MRENRASGTVRGRPVASVPTAEPYQLITF